MYILVPAAYLSTPFWRPYNTYGPLGRDWDATGPALGVLMAVVCMVSVLAWNSNRLLAAFGLLACLLWVCVVLFPVM